MAGEKARIYSYDSKNDGWKKFPNASIKTIKIDQKQRGIREFDISFTHYVKNGITLCGETVPEGTKWYNDVRNQCDKCRAGVRAQTIKDRRLEEQAALGKINATEAEKDNVIDYKTAEKDDHPESAKVSH